MQNPVVFLVIGVSFLSWEHHGNESICSSRRGVEPILGASKAARIVSSIYEIIVQDGTLSILTVAHC